MVIIEMIRKKKKSKSDLVKKINGGMIIQVLLWKNSNNFVLKDELIV